MGFALRSERSLGKKVGWVFGILLLVGSELVWAQVYPSRTRSTAIEWRSLRSNSFVLYYPEEARDAAIRTASILDQQYPLVYARFGGELTRFPIILNTRNSLSNGYVSTFPYRSEIEVRPIKGKVLNPSSGSWLETVVPHELVHAVHYQMKPEFALTNGVGVFSPDLRRSIHGMVPVGLHEGLAVDHETHGVFDEEEFHYGRGSYPYFSNRFDVGLVEEPWSMGQLFHVSSETLPYDRHYVGGYEFMRWVRESYGEGVVTASILYHYRKPFLGYGMALRNQTGKWPSELYKDFIQDKRMVVRERIRATSTPEKEQWNKQVRIISAGLVSGGYVKRGLLDGVPSRQSGVPLVGVQFNRPLWVSNTHIVAHGRFYNTASGFYEIELGEALSPSKPTLVHEAVSVSDYQVGFSADSSQILYAKLVPSLHYNEEWRSELRSFSVDKIGLNKGVLGPKTQSKGDLNPLDDLFSREKKESFLSGFSSLLRPHEEQPSVFGVTQNRSFTAALVDSLETPQMVWFKTFESRPILQPVKNSHPEVFPVQLQLKPGESDQVAVIAKVRGVQGLWIASLENVYTHIQETTPLVSFLNGSVLDVSWHPSQEIVLLTSDYGGVIQLYELDLPTSSLVQVSFSDFNVYEPSYSPDGRLIAFVQQMHPEQVLGIVELDSIQRKPLPRTVWVFEENQVKNRVFRPLLGMGSARNPYDKSSQEPLNWSDLFLETDPFIDTPKGWTEGEVKTGLSWLKPRLWSPVSSEIRRDKRDAGVFFASSDLLREHSYTAEITGFNQHLWWDVAYRYSGFWPGFQVTSKKVPSFQTFRFVTGPEDDPEATSFLQTLLLRERGLEFSVPFQWNFSPGLHRSSLLTFEPSIESTQALFYEESGDQSLSDKVRLTRFGVFTSYRYNLRQNVRQIIPERGALFYFQTEKNFKSDRFKLTVQNNTYKTTFSEKAGVRLGGAVYFPVISTRNQSGRFLVELIRQTDNPVFSLESLTRNLLARNPIQGSNGGVFSEARFVFPLKTIDDGYLTVPVYLNSIYIQTIHQVYIPYKNRLSDGFAGGYSVFGSGISLRSRFRISNVTLDAGIGLFWDSQSKKGEIRVGMF